MANPGNAELFQVLMCDLQQLLATDLLPLKVANVLLQAVIQTYNTHKKEKGKKKKQQMRIILPKYVDVIHKPFCRHAKQNHKNQVMSGFLARSKCACALSR